ncbi:MAG TPA: DUF2530 domain-containing protein [Streptosporangiaceae bacterium]|nr:DUF2530 domain-containing protein [Streptosporangiaceae bacterium]
MSPKQRPEPPQLQTNDVLTAVAGTVAWAVALVVLLLIGLPEPDRWWLWVCVVGIGIGLFAVWYVPRLHRSRAAFEARHRRKPEDGAGGTDGTAS